jgi:hypothetical protein
MSEDFLDTAYEPQPVKRPVFLTVLCILTFVSCGLTFITSIFGILMSGTADRSMRAMNRLQQNQPDMPEMMDSMMKATAKMQDWTQVSNYLALGNVLICFLGAMLMWRLKKSGFFIYTFGQILPFISLYGLYSVVQDIPLMGTFMLVMAIASVIFCAAFIVMYGLNLKHMR